MTQTTHTLIAAAAACEIAAISILVRMKHALAPENEAKLILANERVVRTVIKNALSHWFPGSVTTTSMTYKMKPLTME